MNGWIASVMLAAAGLAAAGLAAAGLAACGAGDDTVDGARANCEFGGTINDCPDSARTTEAACWRLVDCGAIAVHNEADDNELDWGNCVDRLDSTTSDRRRLIVACIAASTCDELRVPGSPDDPREEYMSCLRFGAE
ncbi:MAG: hypothetical protein H0T89_31825 [Deltaproteobacteria bacterium]|nr:hypothetical protein [Deltaproteobacteria bacterium]